MPAEEAGGGEEKRWETSVAYMISIEFCNRFGDPQAAQLSDRQTRAYICRGDVVVNALCIIETKDIFNKLRRFIFLTTCLAQW